MPVLPRSLEIQGEIAAIRRDIHAHPELAYEETRTSDIVAAKLTEWGLEVTRGLGRTGVVGTLRKGNSLKSIGLRADMDALPMDEVNDFQHRSQNAGRMHACGHDGHTAMLLGAAKMLSEKRDFEGAVHFIFQPAEEGGGGAREMIKDGLFEKFPCEQIFGMHNRPKLDVGKFAIRSGPQMAGGGLFDIKITGKGAHGARPETGIDTEMVAFAPALLPAERNPAETLALKLAGQNQTHAVSYGTEAGIFQIGGVPAVVCGPGNIREAHKPDEYIELSQVAAGEAFLRRLIAFCREPGSRSFLEQAA